SMLRSVIRWVLLASQLLPLFSRIYRETLFRVFRAPLLPLPCFAFIVKQLRVFRAPLSRCEW
ncbi:hypothetical protein ABLN72_04925, partial [Mycobacterium tuberculosis]